MARDRNVVTINHIEPEIQKRIEEEAIRRSEHMRVGTIPKYVIYNEILEVGFRAWKELDNQARSQGVSTQFLIDQLKKEQEPHPVAVDG